MLSLSQWPKRYHLYQYLDSLFLNWDDKSDTIALLIMNLDNFRETCELFDYRDIEIVLANISDYQKFMSTR